MGDRNTNGTFAPGNTGGPGRPRRQVEAEYLGIVSNVVSLARWQKIVEAAATLAEAGDSKARDWLSSFVVGAGRPTLAELARLDVLGVSQDDLIAAQAIRDGRTQLETLFAMDTEQTPLHTALAMTARATAERLQPTRKPAKA